ncbi:MAG: NUDIX domain-containing protein [Duncaniella sp.]|nr:NUDIX domain-containing protein [Duncaniella sp.]
MNCDNASEILPLVDIDGNIIGKATRGECHNGSHLLHPVVHLHLFDSVGRLYMQKRPEWKDIQPGKWDTAVGGHIDFGETVDEALVREIREELGIDVEREKLCPQLQSRYVFDSDRESELVHVFTIITDVPPQPTEELDGGRFWSRNEIIKGIEDGDVFTPNFASEYRRFFL